MFQLQTLVRTLKKEGERARTNLQVLETLTYSCVNPGDINDLSLKLEQLAQDYRSKLPTSEGLVLLLNVRRAARKRAQQVSKKYKSLPFKNKSRQSAF